MGPGRAQPGRAEQGEGIEPSRAGLDRGEVKAGGRAARGSDILGDGSLSSPREPLHRLRVTERERNYYQVKDILKTPRKGILGPCRPPLLAEFSRVRRLLGDAEGNTFGLIRIIFTCNPQVTPRLSCAG